MAQNVVTFVSFVLFIVLSEFNKDVLNHYFYVLDLATNFY